METKTAEQILKEKINFTDRTSLQFASVKYFAESGNITGSLYQAIISAMEAYHAQFSHKGDVWVDVKERNPDSEGLYLAWITKHEYLGPPQGIFVVYYGFANDEDATEMFWLDKMKPVELSHWMPLPAPPGQTSLDVQGKSKEEILHNIFDAGAFDRATLRLCLILNPSLEKIEQAMDEYAAQFQSHPLPLQAFTMGDMENLLEYVQARGYKQGVVQEFVNTLKK